jgi:hypothetical protein
MLRIQGPRRTPGGRYEYAATVDTRLGPIVLRAVVSPELVAWLGRHVAVDSMGGGCSCSSRDPSRGSVPEIIERIAIGASELAAETREDSLEAYTAASQAMLQTATRDPYGPSIPGPWLYGVSAFEGGSPPVLSFHVDRWRGDPGELVPDCLAGACDVLSGERWVEARPGTSDILAALGMAGM